MRLLKEIHNLMGNYHVKSGMYHYYRNEYAQAVEFLRKALKDEDNLTLADQRNARYYLTLSLIDSASRFEARGEIDEGVEQLRLAAEVSPSFPDIHFRLGRLLEQRGSVDDAVREYREAIALHDEYLEARLALAFLLLREGRGQETAEAFRQALDVKRRKIETPFERAMELLDAGETQEATDLFHEAFLSLPQLARECVAAALDLIKIEEHEKALAELDRALERNPKYPDVHNLRGVVLCELDRDEEGVAAFRLSSALSPRYLVPRLNLAFALLRLGEHKEAEAELEAILELEADEPAARAKLEELRSGRLPEKRRPAPRGTAR